MAAIALLAGAVASSDHVPGAALGSRLVHDVERGLALFAAGPASEHGRRTSLQRFGGADGVGRIDARR